MTVLVLKGEVFPLEGWRAASDRDVPRLWSLDASGIALVAAFVVGWIVVALGRRHQPRARLLLLAGAALVPAALISWYKAFAMRQFAPLVLLSCVALGIAVADGLRRARVPAPARRPPHVDRGARRRARRARARPVVLTQDHTGITDSTDARSRRASPAGSPTGRGSRRSRRRSGSAARCGPG